MNEIDEYDSMYKLQPSADKLGRERDWQDAVNVRLSKLETQTRELELYAEEQRNLRNNKSSEKDD